MKLKDKFSYVSVGFICKTTWKNWASVRLNWSTDFQYTLLIAKEEVILSRKIWKN